MAEELDGQGNVRASYTYDGDGAPLTLTHQGKTYYYHANGHGDVVALTDESGQVVASYRYDAWGRVVERRGLVTLGADGKETEDKTVLKLNPYL